MITTEYFKYLQGIWNPHRHRQPQSVGPFYLSEWVNRLVYYTRQFEDELEHNLLNTDEPGGKRYLRYLLRQLEAILDPIAQLSTAAPTAVRHSAATGHALGHSSFFQQVAQALNARGTASATPGYDEEEVALPFQNEYIQANFLAVLHLVKQHLLLLAGNEQPLTPSSVAVPSLLPSAVRKPKDLSAMNPSGGSSYKRAVLHAKPLNG